MSKYLLDKYSVALILGLGWSEEKAFNLVSKFYNSEEIKRTAVISEFLEAGLGVNTAYNSINSVAKSQYESAEGSSVRLKPLYISEDNKSEW